MLFFAFIEVILKMDDNEQERVQGEKMTAQDLGERFLGKIQRGDWEVGESLPSERSLMESYGVSRVMVRESLSMLRGLGVLSGGQGRRSVVSAVSAEQVGRLLPLMAMGGQNDWRDVFEVRRALEGKAACWGALRRSDEMLEEIRECARAYEDCLRNIAEAGEDEVNRMQEEAVELDYCFHLAVARASGNLLFVTLLEGLGQLVHSVQREACRGDVKSNEQAVEEHRRILGAIEDADSERALMEMVYHLRRSEEELFKSLGGAHPSTSSFG